MLPDRMDEINYLDDDDKDIIRGFEYCITALEDAFANLDIYMDDDHFLQVALQTKCMHKDETYGEFLHECLDNFLLMRENEIVCSMLDNMTDEEYIANGGKL